MPRQALDGLYGIGLLTAGEYVAVLEASGWTTQGASDALEAAHLRYAPSHWQEPHDVYARDEIKPMERPKRRVKRISGNGPSLTGHPLDGLE